MGDWLLDTLEQIENDLRPYIDRILASPVLSQIREASLSHDKLMKFALQYNYYCNVFPQCLAAVASNIEDDATRYPIVENLWEEHGSGDLNRSHRQMYRRFLTGIGLEEPDIQRATIGRPTAEYVAEIFRICRETHYLTGLGALSLGTEYFTAEEYSLLATGLQSYVSMPQDDLEFWLVHTDADDRHYEDMKSALNRSLSTAKDYEIVRSGAISAVKLEITFWHGIEEIL